MDREIRASWQAARAGDMDALIEFLKAASRGDASEILGAMVEDEAEAGVEKAESPFMTDIVRRDAAVNRLLGPFAHPVLKPGLGVAFLTAHEMRRGRHAGEPGFLSRLLAFLAEDARRTHEPSPCAAARRRPGRVE